MAWTAQRLGTLLVQPAGRGSVFVGVSHDQMGVEPVRECKVDGSGPDVSPCLLNLV